MQTNGVSVHQLREKLVEYECLKDDISTSFPVIRDAICGGETSIPVESLSLNDLEKLVNNEAATVRGDNLHFSYDFMSCIIEYERIT